MDISNLAAFAPKTKEDHKPQTIIVPQLPELIIEKEEPIVEEIESKESIDLISNQNIELQSYGSVEIKPLKKKSPKPEKIVSKENIDKIKIGLYELSFNCNEFNILSNEFDSMVRSGFPGNLDKVSFVLENNKRNYFRNITNELKELIPMELVTFEAEHYIFEDYLWLNYPKYFDTKQNVYINKFIGYIQETTPINFLMLLTDRYSPYYNYDYCHNCIFNKICQRRKLEEN